SLRSRLTCDGSSDPRWESLSGFLDSHADLFASVNTSSARRNLETAVADLMAHAMDQEGGLRGSKGETARQRALRLTLRSHYMRPMVNAAKSCVDVHPELKSLVMPGSHARGEKFL